MVHAALITRLRGPTVAAERKAARAGSEATRHTASSQQKYATSMARFVCYSLRVLQSSADRLRVRETEHGNDDSSDDDVSGNDNNYSDEGNNGNDSSAGHADHAVRTSVDVYKDARRRYLWHARHGELLGQVQRSIEGGWEDQVQLKALLHWYESVIFQRVRRNPFTSDDLSYMLAGVIYCIRMLGVEVILPSDARETQAEADDKRFRQQRDKYLADDTYSVVSKMLSLLAYGKSIALSHNTAGVISWSLDRTIMSYRGWPIKLQEC
ncbi:hypothetical protein LTR56_023576 [Elasticomyces elasticus]|nr:hypothetical protein LTR56_023576 [Elasticomyces elasticus]KAK3624101.1 hypothetical protein LTR22_024116 [Elasticomyces elasticus]KAK4897910.1 hypothetical protein LTR49_027896 [Elasticomyces elasticus]KAK5729943.1 hypothetical protein LTS12_027277 [Elasticomyces elasticus]